MDNPKAEEIAQFVRFLLASVMRAQKSYMAANLLADEPVITTDLQELADARKLAAWSVRKFLHNRSGRDQLVENLHDSHPESASDFQQTLTQAWAILHQQAITWHGEFESAE